MKKNQLLAERTRLASLTVFRELLNDSVIKALIGYFDSLKSDDMDGSVSAYCEFVSKLYDANGGDLSAHIEALCSNSENIYVRMLGKRITPPEHIKASVKNELETLNWVAHLTHDKLVCLPDDVGFLPEFKSGEKDIGAAYRLRTENINKYGYGKYAANRMFFVDSEDKIVPVKNADDITLESLVGYRLQREKIIANTKALLDGKPAANMLLTGDAGTGKSSTVKAVANLFFSEGLRIIEIHKDQLRIIPQILDELAENPLKFILFIDDLSFLSDDDSFNGLKAVLEGSVSAKSSNVAIYATSNRRHIINEQFSDRDGGDIHRNETMQEIVSLSNRFGLQITFPKPDKAEYLEIVCGLAKLHNIDKPIAELEAQAERIALERGGRSARLARQYIDSLLAK